MHPCRDTIGDQFTTRALNPRVASRRKVLHVAGWGCFDEFHERPLVCAVEAGLTGAFPIEA